MTVVNGRNKSNKHQFQSRDYGRCAVPPKAIRAVAPRKTHDSDTAKAFELQRAIGTFVYIVDVRGEVKIGYTSDLRMRLSQYGVPYSNLLWAEPGGRSEELELHSLFKDHLLHGREWFSPAPAIIEYVNERRMMLNVSLWYPEAEAA